MSTEDRVRSVFQSVFANRQIPVPALTLQTVLDSSLGLESLDFAEIVVRLEEAFGTDPFAQGVPPNVRTFGDLVQLYNVGSP